jgi:hypothetical protein
MTREELEHVIRACGAVTNLVVELVQRDEHQRARFARGRRRLDQQILLTTLGISALLHGAHAQLVGFAGRAGARRGDGHRRHGVGVGGVRGVRHCASSSVDAPSRPNSRSLCWMPGKRSAAPGCAHAAIVQQLVGRLRRPAPPVQRKALVRLVSVLTASVFRVQAIKTGSKLS